MKLYELILKPVSGFGTPLKGDTLFGHFCWQAAYDSTLLNGSLNKWISCYSDKPFLIFSSAWPKIEDNKKFYYIFKRPDVPISMIFSDLPTNRTEKIEKIKENKKKKWMMVDENLHLSLDAVKYLGNDEILKKAYGQVTDDLKKTMMGKSSKEFCTEFLRQHNTINRCTLTTGEGMFAPFTETNFFYYPETELSVFILIDEDATDIDKVKAAMENIGKFGFGKDASTGCGRFELGESDPVAIPNIDSPNACYVLSPVIPDHGMFSDYFFTPFIRFGKHGDILAKSKNPFKNPVIMADEGSVFFTEDQEIFQKPYIGQAIFNTSKIQEHTVVHQGYSFYLPFKLEIENG